MDEASVSCDLDISNRPFFRLGSFQSMGKVGKFLKWKFGRGKVFFKKAFLGLFKGPKIKLLSHPENFKGGGKNIGDPPP